jgi:hypothetical protein
MITSLRERTAKNERSFKLSDRFERCANSFFGQFAHRSTLIFFHSENLRCKMVLYFCRKFYFLLNFQQTTFFLGIRTWAQADGKRRRGHSASTCRKDGPLTFPYKMVGSESKYNVPGAKSIHSSQCCGPWSRRAKMTHKHRKKSLVVDVLFWWLKTSPVAWTADISKLEFLIKQFYSCTGSFLVIKTLNPDSLEMLDPDPQLWFLEGRMYHSIP